MNPPALYACICCGYLTLPQKPPGTYHICPICAWEDSASINERGSNEVTLQQAQQNFLAFGACEQEWLNYVRQPTVQDKRDPEWQTIDTITNQLIEQINKAFDGVAREDGVSLHEARVIDDYGGDAERAEARRKDTETRWQDVPDKLIAYYHDVLSFFDPKGFRYYIPAYMIWSLKNYMTSTSGSVDATIYSLNMYSGLENYFLSRAKLLNEEQSSAICQFLRFMATYGECYVDNLKARKSLEKYWGKFCMV